MKTYIRFPLCFMALLFIILTGHISKAQTDNINKNNFYVGAQGNAFIEYFPQFQALHYNTLVEWGQSTDFQRYEG